MKNTIRGDIAAYVYSAVIVKWARTSISSRSRLMFGK